MTKPKKQAKPEPKAKVPPWTAEDGATVKAARLARGMTVTTLAALVHRSPARIYEVEHAYPGRGPNAALRAAIVDALAAQAPAPVKPKAKRAKSFADRRREDAAPAPAEGACPTDEEMAEEARLAAEAGHPVPAEPA
jgi:transcriptional regulator with XRE-family HTH domain